jgi:hypothetical protein
MKEHGNLVFNMILGSFGILLLAISAIRKLQEINYANNGYFIF